MRAMTRIPTREEIALAYLYIEVEFKLDDGKIWAAEWAEGLAWHDERKSGKPDREAYHHADTSIPQLTEAQWRHLAAWADNIRVEQFERPRYQVPYSKTA